MADLNDKLVTFASLKETVTRLKEYANQFEPRKEVVAKSKLTYTTNYIRAYCDYSATIPATVRVTDDNGSVLLVTGSDSGSWRAVRLIKGETDRFHKVYYKNGYVYIQVDADSMYTVFGGVLLTVVGSATGTEIPIEDAADTGIEIPTSYPADAISYVNDTVGSATVEDALNTVIADNHTHDNKEVLDLLSESDAGRLQYNGVTIGGGEGGDLTDYQEKTDNTLDTTDKTITGAINEVNGNLLDTVGFSADYKNIILNRKSGLNPYTIPISAIINNTSLAELKDIDSTDVGNGKILAYDGATGKHKYVGITGTDELVKMDSTGDAHYLVDLLDKQTIINDNGILKVKNLDGQEVTITEINYLKGLTMNVMDLVNAFANGGVKVLNTPLNTASELDTMDRTSFIDGVSYIVYVLADENHAGAKTTYLVDKTNTTFFGNADSQRNFTTNPIDLANEVTGKLGTSNIDVDSLWSLLTIDDTYKTLTTTDNVFGTHGAKAMYDELTTAIGEKANTSDIPTKVSELENDSNFVGLNDTQASATTTYSSNKIADLIAEATMGKDNNIKTYCLLSQLGITSPCTIKDIWDKMPLYSIVVIDVDNSIVTDLDVIRIALGIRDGDEVYGILTVVKLGQRTTLEFRRARTGTSKAPDTFIGYCKGADCTSIQWKQMVITSVVDVPWTQLTMGSGMSGGVSYRIKNGICYVHVDELKSSTMSANYQTITSNLPVPEKTNVWYSIVSTSPTEGTLLVNVDGTGKMINNTGVDNTLYYGSFSYPVRES